MVVSSRVAWALLAFLVRLLLPGFVAVHVTPTATSATVVQVAAPPPNPVLTLISPTVSPVCGDGALAVALLSEDGGSVPLFPTLLQGLAPVVELCSAVPVPTGGYVCALDNTEIGLLNQIAGAALGSASPVAPTPVGSSVLQLQYIESTVTPGSPLHLAPTVTAILQCQPTSTTKPKTAVKAVAVPPLAATPSIPPTLSPPSAPLTPEIVIPSTPIATPAPVAQPSTIPLPPVSQAIVSSTSSGGFRYSAVMLAPLAGLVLVVFLANAFTRPVRARRRL